MAEEIKEEEISETEEIPKEETETPANEEINEENDKADYEKQIKDLNDQIALLKNAYAKAYADTENTKKRLNKEFESLSKYRIQDFALQILPVLDDCERALKQETSDETYRKGVEMIYNKLKSALEKEGVTEIECLDQPFDANWHQALMSEHVDGKESGIVIEVLQKGYKLKDRLLRAAMVKVSD